ncbi:small polypeptide DEVIL 10 [Prosopis cineraria]|uniref:small polypeptide DEVIL 10 n=1 Tax=Prosopis cineraria TaxID=364024 RepID=UPI0024107DA8|nr:small polypeptide DEVIL 10 [Prosopis cineraria]
MAVSHFTAKSQFSHHPSDRESRRSLRKRCFLMAKQQKTRFYIFGRCITMLLCWHDHSISD